MKSLLLLPVAFIGWLIAPAQETLLLRSPSASKDKLVFAYASDIWVADRDGSHPVRLTVNPDVEFEPKISPDGKWVAFSGNYDGNVDVYVISVNGGQPKRLTFHPSQDIVRGWNGDKILFASSRASFSTRFQRLFQVDALTGREENLPLPEAHQGSFSTDGGWLAYIKNPDPAEKSGVYRPFKLYRGGNMPEVWLFNMANKEIEKVPAGSSNNTKPVWAGGSVYFLSDRDGKVFNIYKYDRGSKQVSQLTHYTDYAVRSLFSNGSELVYEQAGRIFILPVTGTAPKQVPVTVSADIPFNRPHFEKAGNAIRNFDISPTGVRAVFEARGEIITVPLEKGDARNLTNTPGVHERSPAWSPDGKYIAYFSDESGEYQLVLRDQKAIQAPVVIHLNDADFYYTPVWSPDGKKILFSNKHLQLFYADIDTKKVVKIDEDSYDRPDAFFDASWSADSKWITYQRKLPNMLRAVFIYELAAAKPMQVTDGRSEAGSPAFSKDGKYLFFTASTDYGRSVGWLDMSSYGNEPKNNIYALLLSKKTPSPLMPESDEEALKGDTSKSADASKKAAPAPMIETDNLEQRIIALPVPAGNYYHLNGSVEGKLYYVSNTSGETSLMTYDITKRKAESVADNTNDYAISADGKKILYVSGPQYGIAATGAKIAPGTGKLNTADLKTLVDPQKEWKQEFNELWRIERDFFYVENMHGADWKAIKAKYEPFLPFVGHRDDLNYLFHEMMAELVIGHNYVGAGDYPDPVIVNTGLLGADYEVKNGMYQFAKIYSGLSWNPTFKAPLAQPGIQVKAGDYLVAVNGTPVDVNTNLYSLFQNTAGKQIRISTNSQPSQAGASEWVVQPIANESNLRLMDWVEGNRKKVDELSGGRVAYVYMPNTADDGYTFFNRYYFSQLDKDAVIVDDRFNGGGSAADYVIDLLSRNVTNYWKNRDGDIMKTPQGVIDGPKVMITNEYAASGGDLMPWMFQQKKLGTLVGKRTLGILVGIYNYPELMDGGMMTAPRLGIFSKDGKWVVENEGVKPDIEVEMTPKEVIAGKDPQLEKAVEVLMKQLGPHKVIKAPKDPVRVAQ
ncbi:MAG: PD40 domain-containing protein [Bacteroidota bacterium]|nr:PD40 domain-containing protein [Bacteroidota bacterium]